MFPRPEVTWVTIGDSPRSGDDPDPRWTGWLTREYPTPGPSVGGVKGRISRLGVLGGTFDPPHVGHVEIACSVRDELELDEVLLVVANDPWQKTGSRTISSAADRLALVVAAVDGIDGLRASSMEIDRGGPSYMIDTLLELERLDPAGTRFLIVGADTAAQLGTWERSGELSDHASLVIVERPGADPSPDPVGWSVSHVVGPRSLVSSSMVRDRLGSGLSIDDLVSEAVLTQIEQRRLYGVGRS